MNVMWQCVVFVPDASSGVGGAGSAAKTEQVRALLPTVIPRSDAVYNIGRTSLLVHALHTSNFELLGLATQDALHQV
jgi:homoserine kinase